MLDLIAHLRRALDEHQPVAWCRLVETRGSTPQKAGATMLVFPDGSQAGTLGGGCVEAEVKRRALAALAAGDAPVLATFQLDSDYGWDDGLICGGRMTILVVPVTSERARQYLQTLAERVALGQGITEAVVFQAESSGVPAPSSFLFDQDGALVDRWGEAGDHVPALVLDQLRPLDVRPRAYAAHGIAYLPVLRRCRLVIVGGGHVGKAVADLAADLDFDVWAIDDREIYVSPERFPRAQRRIAGPIEEVLPALDINSDTYCLIVTRGHSHDERALYHLADRGARYVGLIGSRRKIKLIFEDLLQEGISPEALARVYAPVGLEIGSQTVPEIAVSICAELIAHRNRGEVPARPPAVEIPVR